MIVRNNVTQSIQTCIVGVTFDNRQSVKAQMELGEEVVLIREPVNAFDPNAIMVIRKNGQHVGYLSRELASMLAPRLDSYEIQLKAIVTALTGGYYIGSSLGVMIKFEIPE